MRFKRLLYALCLFAGCALAQTATDSQGGLFSTPGYPAPSTATRPPASSGMPPPRGVDTDRLNERGTVSTPRPTGPRSDEDLLRDEWLRQESMRRPEVPRPSEFQKFVEGATGRLLPVFGARFFGDSI